MIEGHELIWEYKNPELKDWCWVPAVSAYSRQEPCCAKCRHFIPNWNSSYGGCVRNSPNPGFPKVGATHYCGQFEAEPNKYNIDVTVDAASDL